MRDLDKDIEILKNMNDGFTFQDCRVCIEDNKYDEKECICKSKTCDYLQAIENVLSELERYKRLAEANLKDSEEFNKNMCEHRCPIKSDYEEVKQELEKKELEIKVKTSNLALLSGNNNKLKSELETEKKIAERLAKRVDKLDEENYNYCQSGETHCKETNRCIQCIIDWARKEVEKDD